MRKKLPPFFLSQEKVSDPSIRKRTEGRTLHKNFIQTLDKDFIPRRLVKFCRPRALTRFMKRPGRSKLPFPRESEMPSTFIWRPKEFYFGSIYWDGKKEVRDYEYRPKFVQEFPPTFFHGQTESFPGF
jgi:hypothetical protein